MLPRAALIACLLVAACKGGPHHDADDPHFKDDDEDEDPFVEGGDDEPPLPPLALPSHHNEVLSHECAGGCGRWRECQFPAGGGAARCVCRQKCAGGRRRRQVCGSDGRLYPSHCHLHREACLADAQITVDHARNCLLRDRAGPPVETTTFLPAADPSSSLPPTTTREDVSSSSGVASQQQQQQRECSQQEYDLLKENLVLFNSAKLQDDPAHPPAGSQEYVVSVMFSHYDRDASGRLEAEELWRAAERDQLGQLSASCILADMLLFDDPDRDAALTLDEFYLAFGVSVVSLDKALSVNHVTARVGDNVEIKCDVNGTPPPPLVWRRNDVDLAALNEDEIKVFVDGSLYLTNVQLIHGGNYSCHAQHNRDVVQQHLLHVHTIPEVHVVPKLQSRAPGDLAEMECHVIGVPTPAVTWLKNDEELKPDDAKYTVVGNGTALLVGKITYSDTGAYMCVASNPAGVTRDITSLIVQDQPTPTAPSEEHRFFVFHDWGVSVFDPDNCRLCHQVQSTDVIPGTQEYVCGDRGTNCSWGRAVNVADTYVYVTQPTRDRVLVISRVQMVVVDVVVTDKVPVDIHYVPHLDQVWILCWRSRGGGARTVQIIRDASQKKKHHTVHTEPIDGHFDLVSGLFVPPTQDLGHGWKYGYVVHGGERGLHKIDLQQMKYIKAVDLTPYNCAPASAAFATLGGLAILECRDPVGGSATGQVVLDYLTDSVVSHKTQLFGRPHVSPDSRYCVTLDTARNGSVRVVTQAVTENGLRFLFDVKTTLQIGSVAFFPSRTTHSYDLYASSSTKDDVLFVDLSDGRVEMITGVGRAATGEQAGEWGNPERPISAAGVFGTYMVTAADDAVFVVNGKTRTVNCEIGSTVHPRLVVWAKAP